MSSVRSRRRPDKLVPASGLMREFFFKVKPTETGYYFFASAGASAGYRTVSEVFPLEVRAQVATTAVEPSPSAGE